jgi:hypothetical protein
MTRSLAYMPDGQGYATASVEGRIAVEYFDPKPEVQEKKYAFKCHRQTIGEVDHVWPVNCLAFHPAQVVISRTRPLFLSLRPFFFTLFLSPSVLFSFPINRR